MNKKSIDRINKYAEKIKNKYLNNKSANSRIIFHIDVNSAFLSWTALDLLRSGYKEDIRDKVSAISYNIASRRSIILAKSVSAKNFGIKTGESLSIAIQKCPNLEIFEPDYDLYEKCSKDLINTLSHYTYYIEQYSIDECFLDMTDFLFGESPLNVAKKIQKDIKENLGFTVNVGIGNTKVLAKTASDLIKPNKIITMYNSEIKTKLWPMDISKLFLAGKKTQDKLRKININTIGELANTPYYTISNLLGKNGEELWNYANGIDTSPVKYEKEEVKSISNSQTLKEDINDKDEILNHLMKITLKVINRLQKANMLCKTITVEFRTYDFIDFNKSVSLNSYTNLSNNIIDLVKDISEDIYFSFLDNTNNMEKIISKNLNPNILEKDYSIKKIRLLGLKLSNLVEKGKEERSIFELIESKQKAYILKNKSIDKVANDLKDKYGKDIIIRGRNLNIKKEDNLLM